MGLLVYIPNKIELLNYTNFLVIGIKVAIRS